MLEKLMDTGLTSDGLGFGLPASGAGSQYQIPLTMPESPDQKLLQQTIPPVVQPQHPVAPPPPVQPPSAPVQTGPGPSPGF
jgi:hypothetical protein